MQKALIFAGFALLAAGLLWPWLRQIGFGRLPGDISIERDGFALCLPVTTMVLISAILTVLFKIFGK